MNNRNFDEMVERYKREMINCSRRCCPSPQKKSENENSPQRNGEKDENDGQGIKAKEKERNEKSRDETAAGGCACCEEKPGKVPPVTAGDDALCTIAAGCADGGEGSSNCSELNEFLAKNCEKGTMSVNVFAWNTPFGISSARVMVLVPLKSGNVIIYNGVTDTDGKTEEFQLPAPPKGVSLSEESTTAAFAGYTVIVEHPDYQRAMFTNVPVFEGVESVQPVSLFSAAGSDADGGSVTEISEPGL